MAATYGRRNLISGSTLIYRRLQPSFCPHLLLPNTSDRAQSKSRPSPPPPTPHPPFKSRNNIPGLPFHLPLGLYPFLRSYSSSSSSDEIELIKDVADVLTDPITIESFTASAAPVPFPGEVAAAAADSFAPVAVLQQLIDYVHSLTGFNWWASIALTTLLIRGATVPIMIYQMRATIKLSAMRPEMEKLKEQVQDSMDPQTMLENQEKVKALFKKHGVTPFTPLTGLLIQGPIFLSFFMAISNMVEKVPSLKGGGAYWFTDLTTPDPLYALPILTGLTFLATVELNMQEGMEGNPMAGTMKKFFRGLAVVTVPLTAHFPKAIFCYWITSNLFSLSYGFILKRKPVRKFLNLPDITPSHPGPGFSFGGPNEPVTGSGPTSSADATAGVESIKAERRISSSAVMSQRIRNLEKQVKARNNSKKS